jgi:hypothetical protein
MNNLNTISRDQKYELNRLNAKYDPLLEEIKSFVVNKLKSEKVKNAFVNTNLLRYVVVDYLDDIQRLKDFSGIEKVNSEKEIAYTVHWLLRHKPIQTDDCTENNLVVLTINEEFCVKYVCDYLSAEIKGMPERNKGHIFEMGKESSVLTAFVSQLFYFFSYRTVTAQSIEMCIVAFLAGQIYENNDLYGKLHPIDCEDD